MKNLFTLAATGVAGLLACPSAFAQDPVEVAPDHYRVVLEDERVRVLEFTDQPGDKIAMHRHPDYLVYFIEPMKRRFGSSDGKTVDVEVAAGEARSLKAVTHTEENIGDVGARVLIIEFKDTAQ